MFRRRSAGALVAAEDVFAGTALAGAVGVQLGRVDGQALVDVQARLLAAARVHVADEAAAAHALVASERLLARRLAVRPASRAQSAHVMVKHPPCVEACVEERNGCLVNGL